MTAARPRGAVRPDVVYLGWRQLPGGPDPGPPPLPLPTEQPAGEPRGAAQAAGPARPSEPGQLNPGWLDAQRREYRRLTRAGRVLLAAGLAIAGGLAATCALVVAGGPGQAVSSRDAVRAASGLTGNRAMAAVGGAAARTAVGLTGDRAGLAFLAVIAAVCLTTGGWQVVRGRRALARAVRAERQRLRILAVAEAEWQSARRSEYARRYRDWQQRSIASRRKPQWFPVTLPGTLHRVDIAGGTLAGWSALLTMMAAPRLAAGGSLTVVDLTEGAVAADLIAVAQQAGLRPQILVLPTDLSRLELGSGLDSDVFADVLARTVSAAGGRDDITADVTRDAAILGRVLRAIDGPGRPPLRQLLAALRVLGQSAGPTDQIATPELSRQQLSALLQLTGRGAADMVAGRAWAMEAALRGLAPLASGPGQPASPLSVAWLDRQAPAAANDVLAAYLPIALTATLRQAQPRPRWQHSVVLLGAERLRGDVIDRLCAAAEIAGTGLMLCYRTIPAPVRERLGRGHAAVGFMRLGNAEDARAAAEQIGTEHRFVISQLTDTVGSSVTDTIGASYTSSDGTADSVADSVSRTATTGRSRSSGRSGQAPLAGLTGPVSADASRSTAVSATRSISQGITAGTSWGWSTSRAVAASDSLARTAQRSRESVVEPHELQQLPQSAVLLCYPAAGGRQVVLADANPAIIALPSATLARPALAGCDSC